jgi:TPR repeat protein
LKCTEQQRKDYLAAAAKKGIILARYQLAYDPFGSKTDIGQVRLAAEAGVLDAMDTVGDLSKEFEDASHWYSRAAQYGYSSSWVKLGLLYSSDPKQRMSEGSQFANYPNFTQKDLEVGHSLLENLALANENSLDSDEDSRHQVFGDVVEAINASASRSFEAEEATGKLPETNRWLDVMLEDTYQGQSGHLISRFGNSDMKPESADCFHGRKNLWLADILNNYLMDSNMASNVRQLPFIAYSITYTCHDDFRTDEVARLETSKSEYFTYAEILYLAYAVDPNEGELLRKLCASMCSTSALIQLGDEFSRSQQSTDPKAKLFLQTRWADFAARLTTLEAVQRQRIVRLMTGDETPYAEAEKWYQLAADKGDATATQRVAEVIRFLPQSSPTPSAAPSSLATADSSTRGVSAEPTTTSIAGAVSIPHNYALIFATDDYAHWPRLTNPISDADAVNQTLTSLYNFHVEEVRNATDDQVLAKLTEYLHRKFEPQDQLLIMFSGHGYFDPDLGKGFLVPANAQLIKDDVGHRTLLAHETIMGYVNRIPAKHVVLVLDACFAGTLDRKIADSGLRGDTSSDPYAHATLPELLARKEPKRTRRYITSGGKDFVPDGLPGHHSPFISAFLVTLNQAADRKGYLTLDDIQQGLNTVNPEPRWGDIQDDNDPGADFLLLTPSAIAQLIKPN